MPVRATARPKIDERELAPWPRRTPSWARGFPRPEDPPARAPRCPAALGDVMPSDQAGDAEGPLPGGIRAQPTSPPTSKNIAHQQVRGRARCPPPARGGTPESAAARPAMERTQGHAPVRRADVRTAVPTASEQRRGGEHLLVCGPRRQQPEARAAAANRPSRARRGTTSPAAPWPAAPHEGRAALRPARAGAGTASEGNHRQVLEAGGSRGRSRAPSGSPAGSALRAAAGEGGGGGTSPKPATSAACQEQPERQGSSREHRRAQGRPESPAHAEDACRSSTAAGAAARGR